MPLISSKSASQSNFSVEINHPPSIDRTISIEKIQPPKLGFKNELLEFEVNFHFPSKWKFGNFLLFEFTISKIDNSNNNNNNNNNIVQKNSSNIIDDEIIVEKKYSYIIEEPEGEKRWIISGKSKSSFTFNSSLTLTFQCKLYPISTGWLPIPNIIFLGVCICLFIIILLIYLPL